MSAQAVFGQDDPSQSVITPARSSMGRPNILLFLPDQWRSDWTGLNPDIPVRTPNLYALAARGVRFTNALCPSPLCTPSRAALASGKEYDRCGVPNNGVNYPMEQTTFYRMLRDAGYHVSGCGKFDLHKASFIWGTEGKHLLSEWGFSDGIDNAGKLDAVNSGAGEPKDPYMAFLHRRGLAAIHVDDFHNRHGYTSTYPTPLPDDAYCDNRVAQNRLDLMRRFPDGKPWFLQVNFTGPHAPMDITRSMESLYRDIDFPQPHRCNKHTPEQHVAIRRNYSAMTENIDRWLGIYVDEIERRGELDRTLIVFSSDHGEMLGDHGKWGKSQPYQPSVGIPLVVAGPGVRNVSPVSLIDLSATFLEYAGLSRPQTMDAVSLTPILSGAAGAVRETVLSGFGEWRVAYDGRFKLVCDDGDRPVLFDLDRDPWEDDDVAHQHPTVVRRLTDVLQRSASEGDNEELK